MTEQKDKTELTQIQQNVLELIGKGEQNKINLDKIAKLVKISKREVAYTIAELRQFYPICSTRLNGGGVWIADCNKDIQHFINTCESICKAYQLQINYMEEHIR